MPFCFALTRHGETEPTSLTQVDEEICAHFEIEVDEDRWAFNWYNTIGLLLALGRTFEEVKELYLEEDPKAVPVIDFLQENFTADSWREYGRNKP